MMKKALLKKMHAVLTGCLFLLAPLWATAIEFDEIREYGDVFAISAKAVSREAIEIRWEIADGFYLYNNKFLKFNTETQGVVLGEAVVPEGKREFDDLLGEEVVKYHGELVVSLPLDSVPPGLDMVSLKIRSQGCMEDVFCYPPTYQLLVVELPAETESAAMDLSAPTSSLSDVFGSQANELGTPQMDPALKPDEAFIYEAIAYSPDTILVRMTAQPGYYLYRDKLAFRITSGEGVAVSGFDLPEGKIKDDPEFGMVPVYYGQVEIPVRITRPAGDEFKLKLEADYQGCRDGDICYPPQSSSITVPMPASETDIVGGTPEATPPPATGPPAGAITEQDLLAGMLLNNPAGALIAFFVAGLLLAFKIGRAHV